MTTPPALHGWRVLVPRTPEQAAATITALARHGAHGHAVPTICITPPQDPTPLHNALVDLPTGRFAWTIFTSINAVTATRKTLEQLHPNQPSNTHFTHTRVACVGGVTHAALNTWGINTTLTPPHRFSAAGLLDIWPTAATTPTDILLPRADIAPPLLPEGLRKLGWNPIDVTAYRTTPAPPPPPEIHAAITNGSYHAALFTSASTVNNLIKLTGPPHPNTLIACIGPSTATAARNAGLRVDIIPPHATSEALVEALATYAQTNPTHPKNT